jgi:alpha-L-rhamnosidase
MMPGQLMEWFYSGLAGIYQADNSVTYDHIINAPKSVGNIKWVKCSYNSLKGMISSEWRIKGNSLAFNFTIPENSTAKIIIPEAFQKRKINVWNLVTNKIIDVNITPGEFEILAGKYVVIAN